MRKIIIRLLQDRNKKRIGLFCPFDEEFIQIVRQIPGRQWSKEERCWHIPYNQEEWDLLKSKTKGRFEFIKEKDLMNLPEELQKKAQAYKTMLELKKYSANTIKVYMPVFNEFLYHFHQQQKDPDNLSYHEIYSYIKSNVKGLTLSVAKQIISAIKFYYERLLERDKMFFMLHKNREVNLIPVRLNLEETERYFNEGITNPGHRLVLILAWYLGMTPKKIALLSIKAEGELSHYPEYTSNPKLRKLIGQLIEGHLQRNENTCYLFEKKGMPFQDEELRQLVWYLVKKYKIAIIYYKQFEGLLVQAGFSDSTRNLYLSMLMIFVRWLDYEHPAWIKIPLLKKFLHEYSRDKAAQTQNCMVNALSFYYRDVLKIELTDSQLPRARQPKGQPQVLSMEEMTLIIENITNEKHRVLICTIYSAGLRRSELQHLKPGHIDFARSTLFVQAGKGSKDRIVPLSGSLKLMLTDYLEHYKPTVYLFEGEKPGTPYSFSSMDRILKKAAEKARIQKPVYLHLLRHSYATHVLEDGYNVAHLQQLLGHNSIKTTQRYTHLTEENITRVKSPLDKLNLNKPPPE